MKRSLMFLSTLFLLTGLVCAQNEPVKPARSISGGILNGKAISLPKPAYPPAARAVNAEGAVSVQVLIDEQGAVVSASAVSGHPLLRAAATEAAKGATFSPTLLQGEPVKVSGIITYNFIGTITMAGIAYELAFAERSGSFTPYVMPKSLAARLPDEWTEERSVLDGLTFEEKVTAVKVRTPSPAASPAAPAGSDEAAKHTLIATYAAAPPDPAYQTGKLAPASEESLRRLQTVIRSKLASDQKNEWHFRLGTALGNYAAEIADPNKSSFNIAEIEQLAGSAPAGVNSTIILALTKLVELAKTHDGSPEALQMLVVAAQNVKNISL